MPFGVSWSQYLKYWAVAFAGATSGTQSVHGFYKPLKAFDDVVENVYQTLKKQLLETRRKNLERFVRYDLSHEDWDSEQTLVTSMVDKDLVILD